MEVNDHFILGEGTTEDNEHSVLGEETTEDNEHSVLGEEITEDKDDNLYSCPICTKNFSCNSKLIRHMRIHSGERPFICDYCGKGFTDTGNLKVHIRGHTQERPFSCRYCKKNFKRTSHLKRHIRLHINEKQKKKYTTIKFSPEEVYLSEKVETESQADGPLNDKEMKVELIPESKNSITIKEEPSSEEHLESVGD